MARMKYFKQLPDGRNQLISRTTYWRLQNTSGYLSVVLDDSGKLIGRVFVPC